MTSQWFIAPRPRKLRSPRPPRIPRSPRKWSRWQVSVSCVWLRLAVLRLVLFSGLFFGLTNTGCRYAPPEAPYMEVPYGQRVTMAVAPLRNESGSQHADGTKIADALQQQLEQVDGISTLPVNRVLAAMQQLGFSELVTVDQAMALRSALGVDGLVAGTVTAYEPYPPPKLGISVDLFFDPLNPNFRTDFDARQVSYAAVDQMSRPLTRSGSWPTQPVTAVSGFYDAERSLTAEQINAYAYGQQSGSRDILAEDLVRIDMNRFSRFVSYAMTAKLMAAEDARIAQAKRTRQPAKQPDP